MHVWNVRFGTRNSKYVTHSSDISDLLDELEYQGNKMGDIEAVAYSGRVTDLTDRI